MPTLGLSELIVIFMVLMVVFGASRLPALGESLGRTVRSFKRGSAQNERIEVKDAADDATPAAQATAEEPAPKHAEAEDAEIDEPAKPSAPG